MKKLALSLAVLSAILLPTLYAEPAHARTYTWVSHSGSDMNTCQLADPCLTFNGALNLAEAGAEVSCLDSGTFGNFTVTMSVTIDCSGTVAIPLFDAIYATAIVINAPSAVVVLRGLTVKCALAPNCLNPGIVIEAAAEVHIEDCVIENFALQGILDRRTTGGTKLTIKNTIIRNNGSAGIVAAAAPKNSVVLENVHSVGNTFGIAVATGNGVVINRSVMSENGVAGIEADPGATVFVDNSVISHNVSYGVYALGTVGLANSDISLNSSSISGTTMSYGNNRLFLNGPGTAPTPVGATSTDFGQQ